MGLFSCTPPISSSLFPETIELKARSISLDTTLFRYPYRIRVKDDRVVVQDLHGSDFFFHLFSYPNFYFLSSFGKRGEAPYELLQAENFRWEKDYLLTLDCYKSKIHFWHFNANKDSLLCKKVVELDKKLLRPLDFVHTSNNCFLIPDYTGKARLCKVNPEGMLLERIGTIPTSNKKALNESPVALAQGWRSYLDYNQANDVLAMVTQLGDVLEIYDLKKNSNVIKVGTRGEPQIKIENGNAIPIGFMGFGDIQITDSAIYTTFEGLTFSEIARKRNEKEKIQQGGNRIRVYDLNGKPIREYLLDHYINGIHVDEKKRIILAVDANDDEPIIEYIMEK